MPENAHCKSVKAHTEPQSSSEGPERRLKQEDEARQDSRISRNYEEASYFPEMTRDPDLSEQEPS